MRKLKLFKKIYVLALFLTFAVLTTTDVFAHMSILEVEYDDCENKETTDGEDETWYMLYRTYSEGSIEHRHISEETSTIRYWFEESAPNNSSYTWTSETDITEEIAQDIKTSYINSVMKWNNIYYYTYDENGNRISNKIINIIQGTKDNHNLSIFPIENGSDMNNEKVTYFAATAPTGKPNEIDTGIDNIDHLHYEEWKMYVNLEYFHYNSDAKSIYVDYSREAVGGHEMGHVLGLRDVDSGCSASYETNHHGEVLMGYGDVSYRALDITYKDIAGVSIARGFHTDSDHIWMLRTNSDSTKDVICSLCNGVRYDIDTTINSQGKECYENKEVNIYKSCTHYNGSNSNMLLVATNGEQDFYKCQYCRHIETVEVYNEFNLPTNNSSISTTDNIEAGEILYFKLNVTTSNTYQINITSDNSVEFDLFDEDFNVVDCYESSTSKTSLLSGGESYYLRVKFSNSADTGSVITTISRHTHSNIYTWLDYNNHRESCSCGCSSIQGHAITNEDYNSGNLYATCIICGGEAMVGFIEMNGNNVLRTENGSFILSNGVIVLVDDDIEGYLNGTLIFRNNNEDIM